MATEIYLGNPPAHIMQWIKDHSKPAEHPETRFTLADGTVETHNITGTLDQNWMVDNGYYSKESYAWLKSITLADIGNTVTSIGDLAFSGCSSLTSVTIPEGVTNIGGWAFSGCSNLTSVTIPEGVTNIASGAFARCAITTVTIPNSVTSVSGGTFNGCSGLTSITIPDSVTSIEDMAFADCNSLTSVTITANGGNAADVKQMMIYAGVSSGITWNMPPHPETRFTLSDGTVVSENIKGTLDSSWMIANGYYNENEFSWPKNITQADIGTDVTSIGAGTFGYSNLTSVTIPDSVTSIGESAFSFCSNLASVTIPNSVTSISTGVFYNCSSLTSVVFGNGVTRIETSTFWDCGSLTSITIPDTVTYIGQSAFGGSSSLATVTITANGGNAENVKQMIITSIIDDGTINSESITWNMPS